MMVASRRPVWGRAGMLLSIETATQAQLLELTPVAAGAGGGGVAGPSDVLGEGPGVGFIGKITPTARPVPSKTMTSKPKSPIKRWREIFPICSDRQGPGLTSTWSGFFLGSTNPRSMRSRTSFTDAATGAAKNIPTSPNMALPMRSAMIIVAA